jgi:hypothetical protein
VNLGTGCPCRSVPKPLLVPDAAAHGALHRRGDDPFPAMPRQQRDLGPRVGGEVVGDPLSPRAGGTAHWKTTAGTSHGSQCEWTRMLIQLATTMGAVTMSSRT